MERITRDFVEQTRQASLVCINDYASCCDCPLRDDPDCDVNLKRQMAMVCQAFLDGQDLDL